MAERANPDDPADLSLILKRLMARGYRATEESRRTLANDRTTRAFLEAGLTLIADELGLDDDPPLAGSDEVSRPFFAWLSLNKVVERARQDGPASLAMLRDRWPSRSDFIEDLMVYSLWSFHWAQDAERARDITARLSGGGDFVDAVERVGYEVLAARSTERAQRVSLLVTAIAGQDATLRSHRAETYRTDHDTYRKVVRTAIQVWGLKARPDADLDEFVYICTALAEGLILRSIFNPEAVIDHRAKRSLFGKAALMLLAGVLDSGDGLPVSEFVRQHSEA